MNETDEFLEHYGVKGMRWGVRKSTGTIPTGAPSGIAKTKAAVPSANSPVKKTKRKLTDAELRDKVNRARMQKDLASLKSDNSTNSRDLLAKPVPELTDAQLRKRIERVRMEKELAGLEGNDAVNLGQKIANNIMSNSAQNIGTKLITAGANYAINRAIAKVAGEDLADLVYPMGKKDKDKDKEKEKDKD